MWTQRPRTFRGTDGSLKGLFDEYAICAEHGWRYEADWLPLTKREKAHWLAFYKVKGEEEKRQLDEASGKGKRDGRQDQRRNPRRTRR